MRSEHLVRQLRSEASEHLAKQHRSEAAAQKASCSHRVLGRHGQPQAPKDRPIAISRLAAARCEEALASIVEAAFVLASGHVLAREWRLGGPGRHTGMARPWPNMAQTGALLLPQRQGCKAIGELLWKRQPEHMSVYRGQSMGLEAIAGLDPAAAARHRKPHRVASAQLPLLGDTQRREHSSCSQ